MKKPVVGTKLTIIYAGGIDRVTDAAIRSAIDPFDTGSGYSFVTDERDVSATVPEAELPRALAALRKIVGVRVKWKVGDDWVAVPTATERPA